MKTIARFALLLLALSPLSCASGGMTPVSNPMPAARAGLPTEYRIFYDALADYGEWTLIEPYGYVFRPNVSHIGWSPYSYGFWVPNDTFGWVWISSEPFGWATYHYGQWLYDRYEGWVWIPGIDWGPSWVDWQSNDTYVGWSPQLASGSASPPDTWHFVPMSQITSTDLGSRLLSRTQAEAGTAAQPFRSVRNLAEVNGVTINRGPALGVVEKSTGPLQLVRLSEIEALPMVTPRPATLKSTSPSPPVEAARKAAEAARQAQQISEKGSPPPRDFPMVRVKAAGAPKRSLIHPTRVPADTTRH